MRSVLIVVLTLMTFSQTAAAQSSRQPEPRLIKNRVEAEKVLGKVIADQIPNAFNFKLYALVWSGVAFDKDASVTVVTLPADPPTFTFQHAEGLVLEITRTTSQVNIVARPDRPCMGGRKPMPDQVKACQARVRLSWEKADKIVTLFATPRHRLKSLKIEHKSVPRRP